MVRPYSAPSERVPDMAIEQPVTQEFNWSRNLVTMSLLAIAKVRLVTFLQSQFRFWWCSSWWLKTILTRFTSHASSLLSTQAEIFSLINYLKYHVSWLNTVLWLVHTRSTVQGDKLLYGHVPDPIPQCEWGLKTSTTKQHSPTLLPDIKYQVALWHKACSKQA